MRDECSHLSSPCRPEPIRVTLLFFVAVAFSGCASVSPKPETITIDTAPRIQCLRPAITLSDIYGVFFDVTAVKIHFLNLPLEIALKQVGDRTWQESLTEDQIAQLLKNPLAQSQQAKIVIESQDTRRTRRIEERPVSFIINPPPSDPQHELTAKLCTSKH